MPTPGEPENEMEDVWKAALTAFLILFSIAAIYTIKKNFFTGSSRVTRVALADERKLSEKLTDPNQRIITKTIYPGLWSLPVPVKRYHSISWTVVEPNVYLDVEINGTYVITEFPYNHPEYQQVEIPDILKQVRFRICPDKDKPSPLGTATVRVTETRLSF